MFIMTPFLNQCHQLHQSQNSASLSTIQFSNHPPYLRHFVIHGSSSATPSQLHRSQICSTFSTVQYPHYLRHLVVNGSSSAAPSQFHRSQNCGANRISDDFAIKDGFIHVFRAECGVVAQTSAAHQQAERHVVGVKLGCRKQRGGEEIGED